MYKQEIFETVAKHLFKQGMQAIASGGSCVYRGGDYETVKNEDIFVFDGTSCAVGCLIPDEVYQRNMEGNAIRGLIETFGDTLPEFITNKNNRGLLVGLQCVHDTKESFDTTNTMRQALHLVGVTAELDVDFLEELHLVVEADNE